MDQDTAIRIANALEFFVGVHPDYVPTPGKPPLPSSPQAKKILADKLKAEAEEKAAAEKAEAYAKAEKAKVDAAAKVEADRAEAAKKAAAAQPAGAESGKK